MAMSWHDFDDDTETDEAGQTRLAAAGEQRALPGLGTGPDPAPLSFQREEDTPTS